MNLGEVKTTLICRGSEDICKITIFCIFCSLKTQGGRKGLKPPECARHFVRTDCFDKKTFEIEGNRMIFASICEHVSSAFIFFEHEQ